MCECVKELLRGVVVQRDEVDELETERDDIEIDATPEVQAKELAHIGLEAEVEAEVEAQGPVN